MEPTNYLNRLEGKLQPDELQIINLKYKSPVFGKMTDGQLFQSVQTLLLKIHVITGWEIPVKELMGILIDQLIKKIREDYETLNSDEVEHAFRQAPVKEWGKALNLNLIDEVVGPYLVKRRQISDMEERSKPAPVQKLAPMWQLDLEIAYNNLKRVNKLPCKAIL